MKTVKVVLTALIGFALVASAGFAAGPKYSGFLEGYYQNLQPGPEGKDTMRWLKPGVMFGKYDKFMVDSVTFFFAEDSECKDSDPNQMKELSDSFNQAIAAAFKDKYPIVTEPGPDVARIRIAITGFKASNPVIGAVTSILPTGLAVSLVKKGATGSWAGSGSTSVEAEALDSVTDEVIFVAVDERSASFGERFSRWGSAQKAFKSWAERMVKFLDDSRGMNSATFVERP
jgi:hypothetical protein